MSNPQNYYTTLPTTDDVDNRLAAFRAHLDYFYRHFHTDTMVFTPARLFPPEMFAFISADFARNGYNISIIPEGVDPITHGINFINDNFTAGAYNQPLYRSVNVWNHNTLDKITLINNVPQHIASENLEVFGTNEHICHEVQIGTTTDDSGVEKPIFEYFNVLQTTNMCDNYLLSLWNDVIISGQALDETDQ